MTTKRKIKLIDAAKANIVLAQQLLNELLTEELKQKITETNVHKKIVVNECVINTIQTERKISELVLLFNA